MLEAFEISVIPLSIDIDLAAICSTLIGLLRRNGRHIITPRFRNSFNSNIVFNQLNLCHHAVKTTATTSLFISMAE
ncbi:hypothetical protein Bhyg_04086 [Pseudolycoriella hygida]|uniref:Uncharacterized protein n=1 Tax=Pseudolycoriella hygida TaxID=35572 RepID=A0A9Q0NEJ9_9DIPT|nr:hypothetical protein Bhyg_04086 [Pseudolycoriella hygida]